MTGDDFLTPGQLAELLGTTVRALRNWRYRGHGPAHLKAGATIRYRRRDVEAWIDAHTAA